MYRSIERALAAGALLLAMVSAAPMAAEDARFGLGRSLSAHDVAAWDIDARGDGAGLPPGRGDAAMGEEIYLRLCAACHGEFAAGIGRVPALIGGEGSLATDGPQRTVASLWRDAPTLFDYIRRAMPFGAAQTLSADETYALTAFILSLNGLWEDEAPLDAAALAAIAMPNRGGFLAPDPRPDTANRRCMRDCRAAPAAIRSRASESLGSLRNPAR